MMAAPKGKEKLDKLFDEIIIDISENGSSAIAALRGKMSTATFYDLLEDEEKLKRYARATELRAEIMADEIIKISDKDKVDNTEVQSDRLRVDSRKWLLAKLQPKKYGDKIDMTSDGEKINPHITIELIDSSDKVDNENTSG
jgi:hypothetical protein